MQVDYFLCDIQFQGQAAQVDDSRSSFCAVPVDNYSLEFIKFSPSSRSTRFHFKFVQCPFHPTVPNHCSEHLI